MRKLIVTEFVSLDGVMEAPGGEPGYQHSGWVMPFQSEGQMKYKLDETLEAGALLQVNVSSLLGDHGPQARETARRLVRDGRAFCLASDNHPGTRELTLPLGYHALVRAGFSEVKAERLTRSNPRFLLREGIPRLPAPQPSAEPVH